MEPSIRWVLFRIQGSRTGHLVEILQDQKVGGEGVHVGPNEGQERELYAKFNLNVYWIAADPFGI
jgi:hypothetical protein